MGNGSKHMLSALKYFSFAGLTSLCGCGNFFVPPGQANGGGGNTSTSNLIYVANATAATVSGYAVGTGALTAVNGSPYTLGYTPQAMVVSRANNFLYIGAPGGIYTYAIGSDGSLSVLNSGNAAVISSVLSLDVSPDGNWLAGLDAAQTILDVWQINQSTGALTSVTGTANAYVITDAVPQPRMVRFSPDGTLIFAALGTGGDVDFPFNTSTGAVTTAQRLTLGSTQISDNAVLVNAASSLVYIARSGVSSGIAVFSIAAGGVLTAVPGSTFAAGASPYALAFDSTGATIYAANRTDPGSISAFAIGAGPTLTAVSGSPYASGSLVTSLTLDRTGKYLFAAANNGSPDLTMYGFDATTAGKLNSVTSVSTGVDPTGPILVSATH